MTRLLRKLAAGDLERRRTDVVSEEALTVAAAILDDIRDRGVAAAREHAERLGDIAPGEPMTLDRDDLQAALQRTPADVRERLERVAMRIRTFAEAQRAAVTEVRIPIPGGEAGHRVAPVEVAGCYAPGGRYPLPSSVLMTAITARCAGVEEVWVASPRPHPATLAAAAIAGADGFLAIGGAQAIGAMAYGASPVPECDVIVGPGNRYVTAAKRLVAGRVGIDMLAGPSELLIIADASADPAVIAADLLAQAEHDDDAIPVLITLTEGLIDAVEAELHHQLADLPTANVARRALANGGVYLASDLDHAIRASDRFGPEHLELLVEDAEIVAPRLKHYGGLFVGATSAEVLGDYGAGPNHVLPTAGTARYTAGLSVMTFLRLQTFLHITDSGAAATLAADAAWLGRVEGLEAHARSAEARM